MNCHEFMKSSIRRAVAATRVRSLCDGQKCYNIFTNFFTYSRSVERTKVQLSSLADIV